jgi:hypothetical protein
MKRLVMSTLTATALALAFPALLAGQRPGGAAPKPATAWSERTPWGDPEFQGEWTTEGEYGVPMERPAQYGTRAFLTEEEYATRLDEVRARDARDLARVDVSSGKVDAPNAPIPHWREYHTTSRRTSLIVDPLNGRYPARLPGAARWPGPPGGGTLAGGEPCDTYEDYGRGVRCIVHGEGVPDAMYPAVYNANLRIVQSPGIVAISYELIHDTRIIPIDPTPERDPLSSTIRSYMGASRGHWEGGTLVIETAHLKTTPRGSSPGLRLTERLTRTGRDTMAYQVTYTDPATWTAPWTAALDLTSRPADAGVFEYACHEGNYGLEHMLRTSRLFDRK